MSQRAPIRAAIAGAGLMGRWHADSIRKTGGVVAVITDAVPSRADVLAREFGARTARSPAAVTRDLADVVHVCTPPSDHFFTIRSALQAGLHVICEKPLAESAAQTAELYARASEKEVLLCPVHQYLFQDGVTRIMRNLPALGKLTAVASITCSAGSDKADDAARDRLSIDILPNPLAIAARLAPQGLAGTRWHVTRAAPGELQVIGSQPGLSLSIQISTRGRPTLNTLRVTGDRASAYADLFHGFALFDAVEVSRIGKIVRPFLVSGRGFAAASANLARRASRREQAFPGLRKLVQQFYVAVKEKQQSPIGAIESLDVAAARDTIISAFRSEGALV